MAIRKPINKLKKKGEMKTRTLTTTKKVSKPGKEEPGFFVRLWQVATGTDPVSKRRQRKSKQTRRRRR